jgi:hypothetical protein
MQVGKRWVLEQIGARSSLYHVRVRKMPRIGGLRRKESR